MTTVNETVHSNAEHQSKVEWDVDSHEPYITLPGHSKWRLTPLRAGDEDDIVRVCSDPDTAKWAHSRSKPYTHEHASAWTQRIVPQYERFFPQLREAIQEGTAPPVHELRMVLRHVPEPGESESSLGCGSGSAPETEHPIFEVSAGAGSLSRAQGLEALSKIGNKPGAVMGNLQLRPADERGSSESEMLARPPSEQIWEMGCDVLSSLQGRGLGTAMISAGLQGWTAWLGIGKVIATSNEAGCAVARKAGFKEESRFTRQSSAQSGGEEREMIRWARSADE